MSHLRTIVHDERGFTLAELLIATAMMGFVLAAGLLALQAGTQASEVTAGRAEAQSNVRFALAQILSDMRGAGYDPTSSAFDAVDGTTMALSSVTLRADLDASGALEVPGVCDPSAVAEIVRYRLVGTDLMRSVNPGSAACEAVVIGGVQTLTFTYLDATGAITATAANVRAIRVSITLKPEYRGTGAATMTDQARLRNR